jgi:hypothetical protein
MALSMRYIEIKDFLALRSHHCELFCVVCFSGGRMFCSGGTSKYVSCGDSTWRRPRMRHIAPNLAADLYPPRPPRRASSRFPAQTSTSRGTTVCPRCRQKRPPPHRYPTPGGRSSPMASCCLMRPGEIRLGQLNGHFAVIRWRPISASV